MAEKYYDIRPRRDTVSNFTSVNPTIPPNQMLFEYDGNVGEGPANVKVAPKFPAEGTEYISCSYILGDKSRVTISADDLSGTPYNYGTDNPIIPDDNNITHSKFYGILKARSRYQDNNMLTKSMLSSIAPNVVSPGDNNKIPTLGLISSINNEVRSLIDSRSVETEVAQKQPIIININTIDWVGVGPFTCTKQVSTVHRGRRMKVFAGFHSTDVGIRYNESYSAFCNMSPYFVVEDNSITFKCMNRKPAAGFNLILIFV